MGSEAVCRLSYGSQVAEGRALLETTELLFRSPELRLRIPFNQMVSLVDEAGELRVGYAGEVAVFELGKNASKWAEKIRNPRGLLQKLGVKPGSRVAVIGVDDAGFRAQVDARAEVASDGEADLLFYEADVMPDLERLLELVPLIKRNGAIWVVSPKGKGAVLKDVDVMAAARQAGLVDNKVVSFSATHTALKLVIPVATR